MPGYARFLDIMADRRHPEHSDMRGWARGRFDPEWFDPTMTDKDVKLALTGKRRIRMHQPLTKARTRENLLQLLAEPIVDD